MPSCSPLHICYHSKRVEVATIELSSFHVRVQIICRVPVGHGWVLIFITYVKSRPKIATLILVQESDEGSIVPKSEKPRHVPSGHRPCVNIACWDWELYIWSQANSVKRSTDLHWSGLPVDNNGEFVDFLYYSLKASRTALDMLYLIPNIRSLYYENLFFRAATDYFTSHLSKT